MSSRPRFRKSSGFPPLRIVSLAPSVTSILLSLGVRSELVAVSKWCRHVARTGNRPMVGDCWKLDIEEVTRLRPTHVIGSVPFAAETVETILKQPFQFLALNPRTLADIEMDIFTLGRLVARERQAGRLVQKMRASFEKLAPAAKKIGSGRPPVRVYAEAWPKPRICSPPWVAEIISLVGGELCVPAGARVTDEQVAAAAPEIIVLAWTAAGDRSRISSAFKIPQWRDVPAVVNRRVFAVRDEWLNTPGPPLVRGARALRQFIARAEKG
jgi:iron complex transport system substrate-binding protein